MIESGDLICSAGAPEGTTNIGIAGSIIFEQGRRCILARFEYGGNNISHFEVTLPDTYFRKA